MAQGAASDPTAFASSAAIAAQVAAMDRAMKPGQGFAWQPVVRDGNRVAALEIWKHPGRPAVHPAEAEYATVIDGEGTLVSGGTLENASTTRPDLVEGDRIVGGTRRPLRRGDVMLIPAGVPHGFEISGRRLVLLGTKLPTR
ncbi:cupin domain-containing protein [Sphingomonas ginkgonis]|uniref:Cupin domain-containing protein n=1 Tax=Sphingomonas ginkgonis TaxID=2315330 RepID=A0A429VE87_9SPHN|nr:cupin domain-containing protein [Sphingomonas ginkgonis]